MPRVPPPHLPIPHLYLGVSAATLALLTLAAVVDGHGRGLALGLVFPGVLLLTVRVTRQGHRGRGRPVLGLGMGLLTGLTGACGLAYLGDLPRGGPQWIFLPVLFATFGTMLGLATTTRPPTARATGSRAITTPPGQRAADRGLPTTSSANELGGQTAV